MLLSVLVEYKPALGYHGEGRLYSQKPFRYHMYLAGLGRQPVYVLDASDGAAACHRHLASWRLADGCISRRTRIKINAYCKTWNEEGSECVSRAGAVAFRLHDAVEEMMRCGSDHHVMRGTLIEFVSSDVHDHHIDKGTIDMIVRIDGASSILSVSGCDDGEVSPDTFHRVFKRAYLDISDSRLPESWRGVCSRIRCPEFALPPDTRLPGAAYYIYDRRLSGTPWTWRFFEHLKDTALHNLGTSDEVLWGWIRSDDDFFCHHGDVALVMAEMFGRVAWCMPYLPDFTNGNRPDRRFDRRNIDSTEAEVFKNTWLTLSGDCEDTGWVICCLFVAFSEGKMSGHPSRTTRRLSELVSRFYTGLLCQCVASHINIRKQLESTPAAAGQASHGAARWGSVNDEDILSHTIMMMLPKRYFLDCFIRGTVVYADDMCSNLRDPRCVVAGICDAFYPCPDPRGRDRALLPLMCDGTYPNHPFRRSHMRDDLIEDEIWVAENVKNDHMYRSRLAMHVEAKSVISDDDDTRFYKMMVRGFTDAFYTLGYRSCDVCFLSIPSGKRSGAVPTYGVPSRDVLDASDTVGLFFYCEWTAEEDGLIRRVIEDDEPSPSLDVPTRSEVDAQPISIMARRHLSGLRLAFKGPHRRMSVFVRPTCAHLEAVLTSHIPDFIASRDDIIGFDFELLPVLKTGVGDVLVVLRIDLSFRRDAGGGSG